MQFLAGRYTLLVQVKASIGDLCDGRLHDSRDSDHCRFGPCAVGIAAACCGFVIRAHPALNATLALAQLQSIML